LAASILLRKRGYAIIIFEKDEYPFHKVCGEYISFESKDFLQSLGLPLAEWNLPTIDTLHLTAPNGKLFTTKLPLGGFGVSRFKLDSELANLAKNLGVHVLEKTKVDEITSGQKFGISFQRQNIGARVCL